MAGKFPVPPQQAVQRPSAFMRLWNGRDELSVTNIRQANWHFFAAFPLMMLFLNLEFKFFSGEVSVLGLHAATLYPLLFCAGSLIVLHVGEKRIIFCSRIAALLMALGFCAQMLPVRQAAVAGLLVGWLCMGACGVSSWMMFSIRLNNAERLLGVLLMVLSVNAFTLLFSNFAGLAALGKWLTYLACFGLVVCMLRFQPGDVEPPAQEEAPARPVARQNNYWVLLYAVLYFIILQFANEYVAATGPFSDTLHALGGIAAVVLSIIIQFGCRRSVWHMLNILFLAAAVAAAFYWVPGQGGMMGASFFTGMFSYLGDVTLFYICGGVMRRNYTMPYFKRFLLAFYGVLLLSVVAGAFLAQLGELFIRLGITIFVAAAFSLLMMLSPHIYRQLFSDRWMASFHGLDVPEEERREPTKDPFSEKNLTPRETQVVSLLLRGLTMRQISAEIGISYHTVNTYCSNLYKKLNVNSKTELFAQYGVVRVRQDDAPGLDA